MFDELAEQVGKDFDPFDLVCHVAFDQPPLTRRERADNVKQANYFAKYGEQAALYSKPCSTSTPTKALSTSRTLNVLKVQPLSHVWARLSRSFDCSVVKSKYLQALAELESHYMLWPLKAVKTAG